MRSVLITRPQPAADELAQKLRGAGYTAYVAPMMEYVPVAADFSDLAVFQALIFTSTQAVEAFASLFAQRGHPVLAVGDATAAAATRAGFEKVLSARGTSKEVAALVKTQAAQLGLKKILHPCSADTPDDISAAVAGTGVEVTYHPVYRAALIAALPDDVVAAFQRGGIDVVMLFSVRTAENFMKLFLQKGLGGEAKKAEVICISNPVAAVVKELPWRGIRVSRAPQLKEMLRALGEHAATGERRNRTDRRMQQAKRNAGGGVESAAYAGPDRRLGDRRAHALRQRRRVRQEKLKFINRSALTFAFMFTAIVLAGVFLMAPEYAKIKIKRPAESGAERYPAQEASDNAPTSLGGMVNKGIEKVAQETAPVTAAARDIASSAAQAVLNPGTVDFQQVLDNVALIRQQVGGDTAISQSISQLRYLLAAPDVLQPEDFDRAITGARRRDPTLNLLLKSVKSEDVEAAALLLVLNEFRSDINNNRPYAQDIALLRKFTGNDPRMNRALQRLEPYARSGVMSRAALQAELKGLAGDIVTAQMQGQDLSVQQAARQRLEKLSRAAQSTDVQGESADAVVARAQIMLDKGDVKGAMQELSSLNGEAAQTARPWMDNATGYVVADNSSDDLTQSMLQMVTGGTSSVDKLMQSIKGSFGGSAVPYVSPALRGNGGAGVVVP